MPGATPRSGGKRPQLGRATDQAWCLPVVAPTPAASPRHHEWPSWRPEPQAGGDSSQGESPFPWSPRRKGLKRGGRGGRNPAPLCWFSMFLTFSLYCHLTQGHVPQQPVISALSRAEVEGEVPHPSNNSVCARSNLTSRVRARTRELYPTTASSPSFPGPLGGN